MKFLSVIVRIWHANVYIVGVNSAVGKPCLHLLNITNTTTIWITLWITLTTVPGPSSLFFSLH